MVNLAFPSKERRKSEVRTLNLVKLAVGHACRAMNA